MDEPKFSYSYGPSFVLTVSAFVGAELTGVLSVHLFISRRRDAYLKRLQRSRHQQATGEGAAADGRATADRNSAASAASTAAARAGPTRPRLLGSDPTTGGDGGGGIGGPRHAVSLDRQSAGGGMDSPSRCSDTYCYTTMTADTPDTIGSKDLSTYSMLSYSGSRDAAVAAVAGAAGVSGSRYSAFQSPPTYGNTDEVGVASAAGTMGREDLRLPHGGGGGGRRQVDWTMLGRSAVNLAVSVDDVTPMGGGRAESLRRITPV